MKTAKREAKPDENLVKWLLDFGCKCFAEDYNREQVGGQLLRSGTSS